LLIDAQATITTHGWMVREATEWQYSLPAFNPHVAMGWLQVNKSGSQDHGSWAYLPDTSNRLKDPSRRCTHVGEVNEGHLSSWFKKTKTSSDSTSEQGP